jgi:DNA gyrase subunit A
MIINKSGVAIRMGLDALRIMGRNTQGVRLINLKNNDEIAAVAKVTMDKEVEVDEEESQEISEIAIEGEDNVVSQKIAKKKLDSKEQNLENDEE